MPSPEHEFLVDELDRSLHRFATTRLFGVAEAERKKFDYGCLLLRDMTRPLVAQALWSHPEGIDKDLRMLFHDSEALLKVYFVRNTIRHRMRIDEVLQTYRSDGRLRDCLTGLRLIPVPDEFDADNEAERQWMTDYLHERIAKDLLFGVVFGQLSAHDFAVFADHAGPFGLKYAILDEICRNGLWHNPTFKQRLGYFTDSPIREALTMLVAAGFVRRSGRSLVSVPTIKGRLMLDLSRRLWFEWTSLKQWSSEMISILRVLDVSSTQFPDELHAASLAGHKPAALLLHFDCCRTQFGRDLMAGIDTTAPVFHSDFAWKQIFSASGVPSVSARIFDEPESLFFASMRLRNEQ